MRNIVLPATLALAASAHAQSLTLQVETGPSLADGVLSPGETASFTVRAFGSGRPGEPYRALGSLYGFSFGELGLGQFTHTMDNSLLHLPPDGPGLVYDHAHGRIGTSPDGLFGQVPGLGSPPDTNNPIFLFSFEWVPSAFDGRTANWAAAATHGGVYAGGDASRFETWKFVPVPTIGPASGSFAVAPAPAAPALLALAALCSRRRR